MLNLNECQQSKTKKAICVCWSVPGTTTCSFSSGEVKEAQPLFMSATSRKPCMQPNNADAWSRGSRNAPVTHLIRLSLLLLPLLLLLVFFLVVALTRFSTGCSCLALSGLPGWVPSAFGSVLPRIGCVGVRIRVYLEQGEAGGGGGDGDHCRWCHGEEKN